MKIYVMTDLEGVGGVVLAEKQTVSDTLEYKKACSYLVKEVNAAVEGAFKGGADEVIVSDSHWRGFNIDMEQLDSRASCVTGVPRPQWLVGLDRSVDAVICIGMHAMSGTESAVLDHTMSHEGWNNFLVNGKKTGEFGLVVYLAGDQNIPVIFASGDDKFCKEARALCKKIETVETKKGVSRECAVCYTLEGIRSSIEAGVEKAVREIKKFNIVKTKHPVEMVIEYKQTRDVDSIRNIPGRKVTGSKTVTYRAGDVKSCMDLW